MKPRMLVASLALAAGAVLIARLPVVRAADKGGKSNVADHIATFDTLDFDVFTNQKWDRLKESHTEDVTVVWPDGHETHGIQKHIDDLEYMFTYAPDTAIKVHPVKFGSGEWTAVIGEMTGTFTKPMVTADGKTIQPTGKKFKLPMATIAHWTNGRFDKEYLFWDNQSYTTQILGK
jgi:hypothetical protein